MLRSLNSGVTGLINHQTRMDVIGNNISNVNTIGYKNRRVTFGESFSQMVKGATRTESRAGGTNAMQIGLGVQVSSVDMITGQGNLTNTGRTFDLAIDGNAFFGVSDGQNTYYTRNGAFQLDAEGYIVLPTNGMVLQGRMADAFGNFPPGTAIGNMKIPMSQQAPAKATTDVEMMRNLPMDGDAKGNVQFTQRFLHAADGRERGTDALGNIIRNGDVRAEGDNSILDPGKQLGTPLTSLFNSAGEYLEIKEGDMISISWYDKPSIVDEDVTPKSAEFRFLVEKPPTERAPNGDPLDWNDPPNSATNGWQDPTQSPNEQGIAKVYTLDDLLSAMERAINSVVDSAAVRLELQPDGSIRFINEGTNNNSFDYGSPGNTLNFNKTTSDNIFRFNVTSSNPKSQSPLGMAFNFGTYTGPGVGNYPTTGNLQDLDIYRIRTNTAGIPIDPITGDPLYRIGQTSDQTLNPNVRTDRYYPITGAGTPPTIDPTSNGGEGWRLSDFLISISVPAGGPQPTDGIFDDPDNIGIGLANFIIETSVEPIPVVSDKLLRPAEQFDYLANVRTSEGRPLNLDVGDSINFSGAIGTDKVQSNNLLIRANTLLDDVMAQLGTAFKLPGDYQDRDGTPLSTVFISMDGDPNTNPMFGSLVVRSMKGVDFAINNLTAGFIDGSRVSGVPPTNFITNMGFTPKENARDCASFDIPIDVYDDGGTSHTLTMTFTHTGRNGEWEWYASFPGKESIEAGGKGRVFFGQDNTVSSWVYDDGSSQLVVNPRNGSGTMRINLNPGNDTKGLTQFDTDATVAFRGQNGYGTGMLVEVSINEFGLLEGRFSNGTARAIGQIMMVDFANPGGLIDLADCIFTTSANSGDPVWGRPSTQSSSKLKPGALEMANVDLGMEFTNMITTQRGYQANSRIVTVSDSMLEELVNLKR